MFLSELAFLVMKKDQMGQVVSLALKPDIYYLFVSITNSDSLAFDQNILGKIQG